MSSVAKMIAKIEGQMEITHLQPPASFGYQAKAGPMQINGLISLKSAGTGAKVTLKLYAEPGGLFKLAEGLLLNQVKNAGLLCPVKRPVSRLFRPPLPHTNPPAPGAGSRP